jgi:hypothetical protein
MEMKKKLIITWIVLSFLSILVGGVWSNFDPGRNLAFHLYFDGIISSLLSVGYYSTPSNSLYGKIAYGFVVITVCGIAFKILHFLWANEMIVIGLLGIFVTYVLMWVRTRKVS